MKGTGLVVLLDGPALVGRTTTLRLLQERWPEVRPGPLLEVGVDAAVEAFGPAWRRWRELVGPGHAGGSGDAHLGYGPLGRELVVGLHGAAAAWARAGLDVVVDHLVVDRSTATDLEVALDGLRRLHVRLRCDPDVLEERERESGRTPGTAVAQLVALQAMAPADLELDTSESTSDELVDAILVAIARLARG